MRRPSVSVTVPEDAFRSDIPLTIATRGDHVESIHRGTFAVAEPDGTIVLTGGDPAQRTYMRSSAKPFQAMALVLTGTADAMGLTDRDLAIASSSHSGEPEHVEAVEALLQKGGVAPSALQCGTHPPLNPGAAKALTLSGQAPSPLHNNCSGKHAGMLVVCRHMGWPLTSYLDPAHPLQQLNLRTLSAFTGEAWDDIDVAVDGCGVPVFYVRVAGVATAFARIATGEGVDGDHSGAAARISAAMMVHPFLVAGTGRFDTQLMSEGHGTIVCKGGAQGGEGVGSLARRLGLGIKISDGSSASIGFVAVEVLAGLGVLDSEIKSHLDEYLDAPIRNHAGRVVGEMRTTFVMGSGS